MSKFFVGQMVRKARGRENIGNECRVLAIGHFPAGWQPDGSFISFDADIIVRHESAWVGGTGVKWSPDEPAYGLQENYEPILPDGHRAGDFTNVQDLLDSLTREHA